MFPPSATAYSPESSSLAHSLIRDILINIDEADSDLLNRKKSLVNSLPFFPPDANFFVPKTPKNANSKDDGDDVEYDEYGNAISGGGGGDESDEDGIVRSATTVAVIAAAACHQTDPVTGKPYTPLPPYIAMRRNDNSPSAIVAPRRTFSEVLSVLSQSPKTRVELLDERIWRSPSSDTPGGCKQAVLVIQPRVHKQYTDGACGYYSIHNAIQVFRALTEPDFEHCGGVTPQPKPQIAMKSAAKKSSSGGAGGGSGAIPSNDPALRREISPAAASPSPLALGMTAASFWGSYLVTRKYVFVRCVRSHLSIHPSIMFLTSNDVCVVC